MEPVFTQSLDVSTGMPLIASSSPARFVTFRHIKSPQKTKGQYGDRQTSVPFNKLN